MTLAFSTQIKGKPTYFVNKILEGLVNNEIINEFEYSAAVERYLDKVENCYVQYQEPKLHTIREDKSNRWKAGNDIHFVINNRTKNRFQFSPIVKCVSVQKIQICYNPKITDKYFHEPTIFIDEKPLNIIGMELLAINDGFDTLPDFLTYFNKDFTGKLIHWTDLKY